MAKNRFPIQPKQQTAVMSPPHPHTVATVVNHHSAEDDEDDICPVCDGECTCDNKPRPAPAPMNDSTGSVKHATPTHISNLSSPAPTTNSQSLKIRLTIPSSLLGKRRAPPSSSKKFKNGEMTTSAFGNDDDNNASSPFSAPGKPLQTQVSTAHGLQDPPVPKRRGRPPKAVIAARELALKSAADSHAANTLPSQALSHSQSLSSRLRNRKTISVLDSGRQTLKSTDAKLTTTVKDKGANLKNVAPTKRRRVVLNEFSDLSDVEHHSDSDNDDARSVQFPTFVSASAMSCTSSNDSDTSSLSDIDTDSSIEAEEEDFILTEESRVHNKARVRRELLGGEGGQKKRDSHNNWVIRPRKMSVGPSDVEMDVETEASDQDDDEEDEEDEDEGEADEEETDDRGQGVSYVGVATGWSEDEESSFDADLFFANLSDTEGDNTSTVSGDGQGEDGDQSDLETTSFCEGTAASLIPQLYQDMGHLPLEITQGWDGQVVFTNGLREGQGILDIDFEVNAAQLVAETSASPSQDSDVDMFSSEADEAGYVEDGDAGEGETTDEELVGDDDLPNERAMQIFNLPFSVSAINPMSTMSPVSGSRSRNRRFLESTTPLDSPKPADILAGKVFWEDSDGQDECDDMSQSRSVSSSRDGLPRQGIFLSGGDNRLAIIDNTHADIPSPHPRFIRGGGVSASRLGPRDETKRLSLRRKDSSPTSLPSNLLSLQLLSTEEMGTTSPKLPPAEPINLDDVLDASLLDSGPSDLQVSSTDTIDEVNSRKHLKNLSRWDLISVGAFRRTRETAGLSDNSATGWGSDTPRALEYGSMMKSSPLSTMLCQNKNSSPPKRSRTSNVAISPALLPVREHDGDRTPMNAPPNQIPPPHRNHHYPHKNRKESRRERKMKRKSYSSVQQHQNHQHHYHQHHPNSKTRSTSSSQRTNFFSTSSSMPNLIL